MTAIDLGPRPLPVAWREVLERRVRAIVVVPIAYNVIEAAVTITGH